MTVVDGWLAIEGRASNQRPQKGEAMKSALLAIAVLGYILAVVAPAWAACPAGTRYQCHQGYNGKVICSCS
jgi:hypothetical protein